MPGKRATFGANRLTALVWTNFRKKVCQKNLVGQKIKGEDARSSDIGSHRSRLTALSIGGIMKKRRSETKMKTGMGEHSFYFAIHYQRYKFAPLFT
jgi:hypothetical protein